MSASCCTGGGESREALEAEDQQASSDLGWVSTDLLNKTSPRSQMGPEYLGNFQVAASREGEAGFEEPLLGAVGAMGGRGQAPWLSLKGQLEASL